MAFGASGHGAIFHRGLQPLGQDAAQEIWCTSAPKVGGSDGAIKWRAGEDMLFGSASVSMSGDAAQITHDLYREVFQCLGKHDFPHLLRVWHFLPHINHGAGDGEHYKRFCLGRARAFDEQYDSPRLLPAGTAIGTRSGNQLQVYFLATRVPGRQLENPRQLSAFKYPRRYGPREPLFSRSVVWSDGNEAQLLISGTASIVGHESLHTGDLEGQLQETWRNVSCLRDRAGTTRPIALRVYVRRAEDYPTIRDFLNAHLPADAAVLYLLADICRAELLMEIEGVFAILRGAEAGSERPGLPPGNAG